jgi:hypothetical protein
MSWRQQTAIRAGRVIDYVRGRKRTYQLAFKSPAGQQVLTDLAKFCRANDTTFHSDPRLHAVLEGRREVWLRIANHLNLTTDQLYALYMGASVNPQGDPDAA